MSLCLVLLELLSLWLVGWMDVFHAIMWLVNILLLILVVWTFQPCVSKNEWTYSLSDGRIQNQKTIKQSCLAELRAETTPLPCKGNSVSTELYSSQLRVCSTNNTLVLLVFQLLECKVFQCNLAPVCIIGSISGWFHPQWRSRRPCWNCHQAMRMHLMIIQVIMLIPRSRFVIKCICYAMSHHGVCSIPLFLFLWFLVLCGRLSFRVVWISETDETFQPVCHGNDVKNK